MNRPPPSCTAIPSGMAPSTTPSSSRDRSSAASAAVCASMWRSTWQIWWPMAAMSRSISSSTRRVSRENSSITACTSLRSRMGNAAAETRPAEAARRIRVPSGSSLSRSIQIASPAASARPAGSSPARSTETREASTRSCWAMSSAAQIARHSSTVRPRSPAATQ